MARWISARGTPKGSGADAGIAARALRARALPLSLSTSIYLSLSLSLYRSLSEMFIGQIIHRVGNSRVNNWLESWISNGVLADFWWISGGFLNFRWNSNRIHGKFIIPPKIHEKPIRNPGFNDTRTNPRPPRVFSGRLGRSEVLPRIWQPEYKFWC